MELMFQVIEGCYSPRPSALVGNIPLDLHNSSNHTKGEFNDC